MPPKEKSRQNELAKKANNNNINSTDSKDKINTSRQVGYWLNRPFPRFFSTFDMYKIGKILQQPYFPVVASLRRETREAICVSWSKDSNSSQEQFLME